MRPRLVSLMQPRRFRAIFALAGLLGLAPPVFGSTVEIVAHRGGYLLAPENTLAAFRASSGLVSQIEFDVHLSADGQLVVIHDDTVNRTTTGWGTVTNVNALTVAELKTLDAGAKFSPAFAGERIPTLAEALATIPPETHVWVDRKSGSASNIVAALRAANRLTNATVVAGNWDILLDVKKLEPSLRLCAAGAGELTTNSLAVLQRLGIGNTVWAKTNITAEVVERVHSYGLRLHVPLTSYEVESYLAMGVDGILIDNPLNTWVWSRQSPPSNRDLSRGLIAYWKLDDGLSNPATLRAEDVELISPGRLFGFGSPPTWLAPEKAKFGGALAFDGINDYVFIPSNSTLDIHTNELSISLWVNLAILPSQLSKEYGSIYDDLDKNSYIVFLDRTSGELRFRCTDTRGHAARPGIPETLLKTGVWHHVVGVYNGNAGRGVVGQAMIYLDGQLVDIHIGSDAAPGVGLSQNVLPGQQAAIGRNGNQNDYYFRGALDDIAIWRRALTPADVRRIYSAGTNGYPLERSAMLLWITNASLDPVTSELNLSLHVEHGSLTNQPLILRGATRPTGSYTDRTVLTNATGRNPRFRISTLPPPTSAASPSVTAEPLFFYIACP